MATDNPLISEKREDNYELELIREREKIKSKFVELIDCLKARESELLRELDNMRASYLSYRSELVKSIEKKREMNETLLLIQNMLQSNQQSKSFHENIISLAKIELKSIETPIEPKMFTFECEGNKILSKVNNLGEFVEKVGSQIDYKNKRQPLVIVCENGEGMDKLSYPHGVTFDKKTGNIYIAVRLNNCVKVFDSTGKYLFKFGDNEGEGKMYLPRGVAICEDRILITQYSNSILNYQLNGKYICRIGTDGRGELEFKFLCGLTIDESNGDIYICDNGNNRIQILSKVFTFKSQFGKETLKHPLDVKLSKEYIFVLDESNPCLHLFNYNYILQKSVISKGTGNHVIYPCCFFRDHSDNFLISDLVSNSILIFNTEFNFVHKISVSNNPTGVAVDKHGRVIVVSHVDKNCLQIF